MPGRGRAILLAVASTVATAGLAVAARPAAGHEESPGTATVFDRAVPELPPAVRVQVVRSAADQLLLGSDDEEVEVLADGGEAFLRIGPAGTFANLASATWHEVQRPEPPEASPAVPAGPARWEKVSDGRSYGWFDHRLHPSRLASPTRSGQEAVVRLGDWRVPLRIGGRPVELLGHRQLTRLAGAVTATVDQSALAGTGLVVSVASGRVPAVVLDASAAVGAGPVVVLGEGGEPMLRFTTSGTEANQASPTWGLTAAARGGAAGPSPVPAAPAWQRIAEASTVTWLEPRAAYQPGVPPEDVLASPTPVVLGSWSVPIELGGRRVTLQGASSWTPDPSAIPQAERGGLGPRLAIGGGIIVAAVAALALAVVRRRSARAAAAPGRVGHR